MPSNASDRATLQRLTLVRDEPPGTRRRRDPIAPTPPVQHVTAASDLRMTAHLAPALREAAAHAGRVDPDLLTAAAHALDRRDELLIRLLNDLARTTGEPEGTVRVRYGAPPAPAPHGRPEVPQLGA